MDAGDFLRRGESVRPQVHYEEALMRAALEKLPTHDRVMRGILCSQSTHNPKEVEIQRLGFKEKRDLVDRLVHVAEEDNERFISSLCKRIAKVGITLPTVEVRFHHLTIEAEALPQSMATPTFFTFAVNLLKRLFGSLSFWTAGSSRFAIIKDVSGVIKPSRMTLLLGPRSSGKTTLLLALAGKLDKGLEVSGMVTHNGHTFDEFVPERTAAYVSQNDLHIPEMTVRETLDFSARCQGFGSRYQLISELLRREKAAGITPDTDLDVYTKALVCKGDENSIMTEYVLKILGLEGCADTLVGNDMIRGISGGQKKRVTTGEMLVGPMKTYFMDEISTGLDSSTTYQIVKILRQNMHITGGTTVVSLLQPAPETFELFDDIMLLSDGQIVYHGPREEILDFFEFIGFKCPKRKGVADFLQEMTSRKDQGRYWARNGEPYEFVDPDQMVKRFRSFPVGKRMEEELEVPFDKSKSHKAALSKEKYGAGSLELLKACLSREILLMKRNSFLYGFKFLQTVLMGLITMTIFLRTDMHRDSIADAGLYLGVMFYIISVNVFNAQTDASVIMSKLPVFFKQRNMKFFPAWSYAMTSVIKIPISILEVSVPVFMMYYVIGFDPAPENLFKYYLAILATVLMSYGLFRAIAAISRHPIISGTCGISVLLVLSVLGGFLLPKDDVKKWWLWAYWVSPIMYSQNAIVINEFQGKSWSHIPPNSTKSLGIQVLESRGFSTDPNFYWICLGALCGFYLLFHLVFALALTFLNPISLRNATTQNTDQISKKTTKGMILPFKPHSVCFDSITYSVDIPQEMKSKGVTEDKLTIIRNVSGTFRPGVLTALMGVSGAGKTTLMDVLGGRKTGGYIEGNITVSGRPKNQETFARILGYCEQTDIHSPHVTVYESLVFSAWLRLTPDVTKDTRMMFVEEVMELVELTPIRNSLVGLPGVSGLTTEQRKRLTIAVELVANPSVILMDEPTSGLDARAAAIVMRAVRNTVDTGRTVVCTIHQPSIDIFESFDELLLLKRGGEQIFFGPIGRNSSLLIDYFERIEGVDKIKDGYNPSTWMLEMTSPMKEHMLGVDFAQIYKNSDLYRRNKVLMEEQTQEAGRREELHFATKYSQPFLVQCMACLWKQHRSYWSNPFYTSVRFLFTTFIALIFGSIFWGIGSKPSRVQDLINAMGSMYASALFLGTQNASGVQPVVAAERIVFYRERAVGMYSAFPYAFGQAAIEVPYILLQTIVYGVIVYSMIGYPWDAAKFFWYLYFMFFLFSCFTFYGMMAIAMAPSQQVSSVISAAYCTLGNLFSGFLIPRPRAPIWWRWVYWLTPLSWTFYGLVESQFGDVHTRLETGETVAEYVARVYHFHHGLLPLVATIVAGMTILYALAFGVFIMHFNFQRR